MDKTAISCTNQGYGKAEIGKSWEKVELGWFWGFLGVPKNPVGSQNLNVRTFCRKRPILHKTAICCSNREYGKGEIGVSWGKDELGLFGGFFSVPKTAGSQNVTFWSFCQKSNVSHKTIICCSNRGHGKGEIIVCWEKVKLGSFWGFLSVPNPLGVKIRLFGHFCKKSLVSHKTAICCAS